MDNELANFGWRGRFGNSLKCKDNSQRNSYPCINSLTESSWQTFREINDNGFKLFRFFIVFSYFKIFSKFTDLGRRIINEVYGNDRSG